MANDTQEEPTGLEFAAPIDLGEPMTLKDAEKRVIAAAIARTGGNISKARIELGIGRTTLYRKMREYGLR